MSSFPFGAMGIAMLYLAMPMALFTAEPPGTPRAAHLDSDALAATIDRLVADRWAARKVQPAPLADDAEFIRRVYLDLVGCIPSIIDTRDFLDDSRPGKRRIWVEELLEGRRPADRPHAYPRHFANVWRAWLLSRSGVQAEATVSAVERWFHQRLNKNMAYDRMVFELIAVPPGTALSGSVFDQVNEDRPDNLAAGTARFFLGIKLECAQCHDDRSGGNWTRTQFWELAAFFAQGSTASGKEAKRPVIMIPGKDTVVQARFLDGRQPSWSPELGARPALAQWLTSPSNPYFARAGANRIWAYFFGVGLVEPIEEMGDHNPPSHPELLDELAEKFAAHQFDLKFLIRAITSSRVYQLSSASASPRRVSTEKGKTGMAERDPRLFSQKAISGLSPEQMFDSLAEATEYERSGPAGGYVQVSTGRRRDGGPRAEFMERFANQYKPTETQTSVLQALYLMNGQFMAERTSLEHNRTLVTIANATPTNTQRQVKTLFLVVLSREPRPTELARLVKYIDSGGAGGDRRTALADIYWALLNSAEFRVNH